MKDKVEIFKEDYLKVLETLQNRKNKLDIIFLDPPYISNYDIIAINYIIKNNLLAQDGIIIVETDEEEKIEKIEQISNITVFDIRKYGRAKLIFLKS